MVVTSCVDDFIYPCLTSTGVVDESSLEIQDGCFRCCSSEEKRRDGFGSERSSTSKRRYKVVLAVSPLAGLKGFVGYHSSVIVAGEEFFFSPTGIGASTGLPTVSGGIFQSHNAEMQLHYVGHTDVSGFDLLAALARHFKPGTYDLLLKNCNHFTDCALYVLCGRRMWRGFCAMERLGAFVDGNFGFIQKISQGEYTPNDKAVGFDVCEVIEFLRNRTDGKGWEEETLQVREQPALVRSPPHAPTRSLSVTPPLRPAARQFLGARRGP
eukprot:TRINITY_DN16068_c0_g1_i2.p1 TRINITY_DN16068_c0_g1~~TRINITY_DN16068_c0_g1_i2.p1  ORF type:complete len:268 (-),score=44.57 TRINITY_DN16068_c0_g1_i2:177-980(-)